MAPPRPSDGGDGTDGMPDLSHLTQEERQIILQVLQRQKAEEQQEEEIAQKGDRELWDIERQIQERKEIAQRLIGTQDDAICQICQKTKFADGIGHKCVYCQLRSCARCGGKATSKSKTIWACSLCQKRQQILAKTGKWFQQGEKQLTTSDPSPAGGSSAPISRQHSEKSPVGATFADFEGANPLRRQSVATIEQRTIDGGGGQMRRQNTLHRQNSVEENHQCQLQQGRKAPSASGEQLKSEESTGTTWPTTTASPGTPPDEAQNSHRQTQRQKQQQSPGQNEWQHQGQMPMPLANPTEQQNQWNGQMPNSEQNDKDRERKQQQQRQRAGTEETARRAEKRRTNGDAEERGLLPTQKSEERRKPQLQRLPTTAPAAVIVNNSPASRIPSNRQSTAEEGHSAHRSLAGAVPSAVSRHSVVVSSSGVPSPARRRQKANRQHQLANCSSSDDELSSPKAKPTTTQQFQQSQPTPPLPKVPALSNSTENGGRETDFSEKELLRYIYDNAHPNARKAQRGAAPFLRHFLHHHSLDSPAMVSAAARVTVSAPFGNASKGTTAESNALANRIKNYLSNPAVSWQPSTDQRHLIGHMVLSRPSRFCAGPCSSSSSPILSNSSLDFGLKVVGGRSPLTGRFGAFVSRVRPGSLADSVGQLRTGDEVLEWNGHSLQNVTPETVYKIVQATKGEPRLELIVSRPLVDGGDDFLNLRQIHEQCSLGPSPSLPHSQSLNTTAPFGHQQHFSKRAPSPLVLHQGRSFSDYFDPMAAVRPLPPLAGLPNVSSTDPQEISSGRIELALLYLRQKRELIISLGGAFDLFPRSNGTPRNAYVKLFLLPDRSERSRRQSKVIADTLAPAWNEHFFYEGLDERAIAERVLEVTLWDFDPFDSHSFLGETLIELSTAPLNNRTLVYSITDLDDDNFIRLRLRQRRFSSMTPPMGQRSRSQMSYPPRRRDGAQHRNAFGPWENDAKGIGGGWNSHSAHNLAESHSRNKRFLIANDDFWKASQEDWTRNEEEDSFSAGWERDTKRTPGAPRRIPNGYLSDQEQEWETDRRRHGGTHRRERREHRHHRTEHRDRGGPRRPQSATALRNIAEWEMRHKPSSDRGKQYQHQQSMDYSDGGRNGEAVQRQQIRRAMRRQELREREAGGGGYGSDGSEETLMSVNSAQSMQNKAILRQQQLQRLSQQNDMGQSSTEETNERAAMDALLQVGGDAEEMDDAQMMLMAMEGRQGGATTQQKITLKELKDRKKSLMTRLIPGRNGLNDANKRLGFARSEEVGIPEALAPPEQNKDFIKQESTDSSDNWLPIRPDRPLGSFVENLGPGQVVGRQALGSAQLGELQAALSLEPCGMVVDVMQARGLTALKQSTKTVPGIYVKAYLMEGKNCLAKAKTQPTKTKSSSPQFRQKLVFAEGPRFRMLQLTVLADFGRIERKSFLGVAQIALDELQLSKEPLLGWFKLFPSSSLNGAAQPPGGTPSRKNSEGSAN